MFCTYVRRLSLLVATFVTTRTHTLNRAVPGSVLHPCVGEDGVASVSLAAAPRPAAASPAPLGQLMRPDYVTFNNLINF